jgi:hypothetical protein
MRRQKWKEYWAALRLELGGAKEGHALPAAFLRQLPALAHDDGSIDEEMRKVFGSYAEVEHQLELLDRSNDLGVEAAAFLARAEEASGGRSSPLRRRPARHEQALTKDHNLSLLSRLDWLDAEDYLKEKGAEEGLLGELREAGRRGAKRREEAELKGKSRKR